MIFDMMPISSPTTPTSALTAESGNDYVPNTLDFDSPEGNKEFAHSLDFNKEVMAEDLLIKTLPNSLVSQKTPSLRFSTSSMSSKNSPDKIK
jgi:hypothetical protein